MDDLPPLTALRAFDAAGRLSSITGAAEELFVSPPAISRQIRILEETLGVRLFDRNHRSVTLTPEGASYHAEVAKLFAGLRRATRDLIVQEKRGRIFNIWAPHTIAMRWLLSRLASLHQQYPEFDVRLHTSLVKLQDFAHSDIDAGIFLGKQEGAGLIYHKIMRNEIAPVCTPDIAKRLQRPEDLTSEKLLHTHARPDDWTCWLQAAKVSQVDAGSGLRYESSALAYEAALGGYGVVIGQREMIETELADGRLVAPFDLWIDRGDFTYYFAIPETPDRRHNQATMAFRQWVESFSID